MRGWALLILAAGCGRLGFDGTSGGADGAAPGDGHAADTGGLADAGADTTSDSGTAALVPVFSTACTISSIVVIQDGVAIDDAAGNQVANASAQACGNGATVTTIDQNATGVLDTAGRPLLGPSKIAFEGGGDAFQRSVQYLEMADTPLIPQTGANRVQLVIRATGAFALDVAANTYGMRHDMGYLQVTLEPTSNTLVLSAIGNTASGTTAAGLWFDANRASIVTSSLHWYVIDWQDTDATTGPSAGDTFMVVSSG